MQHTQRVIRAFEYSVVSDQPAQSAQDNLKRHFPFLFCFVFCFVLEQVFFSTKSNAVVKCRLHSPRRLIRDDTLRKCQNVYFRELQANYDNLLGIVRHRDV